jgi:DNA modification methylase
MTQPVQIHQATLYCGDSMDVLATLDADSIDSIVTDPPYGIRFMGKEWDGKDIEATMHRKTRKETCRPDGWKRHDGAAFAAGTYNLSPSANQAFQKWTEQWASLCLRVLKPGGHLLSFASPRMYHRMASGIEDAGFEIRDQIMWVFGSGFPKSHNLKGEWNGWGTALKPAHEPIVVARKPLIGTVAENVLKHGTGALNIDGCRVETDESLRVGSCGLFSHVRDGKSYPNTRQGEASAENRYSDRGSTPFALTPGPRGGDSRGRWPANLIHDGGEEVLAAFPDAPGQSGAVTGREPSSKTNNVYGQFDGRPETHPRGDKGTAARFFYCAKASRKDRNEGCEAFDKRPLNWSSGDKNPGSFQSEGVERSARNHHPTVKPTQLMRYLCRLVTSPRGTVLDCFMGSGSTGKAALKEGFRFIGIEREPEYFQIACSRVVPGHEQPEMIIPMPDKKPEPERQPDLFGFSAA